MIENKDVKELKSELEKALGNALHELKLRSRTQKLSEIQRMFGYALGIRTSLMILNKNFDDCAITYDYIHANEIEHLLKHNFGSLKLADIRDFAFLPAEDLTKTLTAKE